ncbi:MAG TPA: proton-conducting transporter membrane subunit [Tepidisphaeraceae bacterium]|nr:proton-conducting transporter membrane subunit [Tepidisphaeraceae bacterium]
MPLELMLVACVVAASSGMPGLVISRRSNAGQWIAAALNVVGSTVGGCGLIAHYFSGTDIQQISRTWSLPLGHFAVGIDGLSAVFLVPILLISALGSIYGLEYWRQSEHPRNGKKLRFCWGLLTAAMMLVVLARDAIVLLMGWEIMALAAFFLVATEDWNIEVRRAAWVFLVAAHVGTLCLFALFGLLRYVNGSFDLWASTSGEIPAWLANTIFVVGMIGFGLKAGIMPLHVWLPGAHANAPSHVSAILSGVLLKAGVYGMIRVAACMPHPPMWWGMTLLVIGSISGILGIAFAVAQHDFKRLLAYSSVENIGIITIGIGLALLGRSAGHSDWIVLGLGGALLHLLNHSLFKPLLFMGAGSVLHAVHTRQSDLLGGLAKFMPRTFALIVIGAMSICGLPPFNGFVSEFLIYIGLFHVSASNAGNAWISAALAAPALAMIGALAVAAFVKLIGGIFCGTPRTETASHAHDPHMLMLVPMVFLAVCCVLIGLLPMTMAGLLQRAIAAWEMSPSSATISIGEFVPLYGFLVVGLLLAVLGFAGAMAIQRLRLRQPSTSAGTWDCGYLRPTSRIQYTGSSLSEMLTKLFGWVLFPKKSIVVLRALFPNQAAFSSETPDTVLDRGVLPPLRAIERAISWIRPIQGGPVQVYLLYVLAALLTLLVFASW